MPSPAITAAIASSVSGSRILSQGSMADFEVLVIIGIYVFIISVIMLWGWRNR